ncbi:MAG TPA: hypothetical protein VL688_09820 [Verrucomicrobiae bacterium]|jgi:hypothetical protein|nr:hypothetical protein [Verrucomicrobiae bacterium]
MKKRTWLLVLLGTAAALDLAHFLNFAFGWPSWFLRFLFDLDREGTIQCWFSNLLWLLCAQAAYDCGILERRKAPRVSWHALAVVFLLCSVDEVASIHEHLGYLIFRFLNSFERLQYFHHSHWPVVMSPLLLLGAFAIYRLFWICFDNDPRAGKLAAIGFAVAFVGAVVLDAAIKMDAHTPPLALNLEVIVEESLEMAGVILMGLGLREHRAYLRAAAGRE